MRVGAKELKNRLGHYLRVARAGERIYVTDRGKPVAELRGLGTEPGDEQAVLNELRARGVVTGGRGQHAPAALVTTSLGALLSQAVMDDRG